MQTDIANKNVIRRVLEDTRYAYRLISEYSHSNADYAEFASRQALNEFRAAFGDPDMTYEELSRILRIASNTERRRQCKTPWAMFMANYIERSGNMNAPVR